VRMKVRTSKTWLGYEGQDIWYLLRSGRGAYESQNFIDRVVKVKDFPYRGGATIRAVGWVMFLLY